MKRLLVSAVFLFLGLSCAVAQETGPAAAESSRNVTLDFSTTSASTMTLMEPRAFGTLSFGSFAAPEPRPALALAPASPEASPSPEPKLLYSSRDDYRWQLGIGLAWYRFRSNIFSANAIGTKTSVTYYTNEWFGVEGNVTAAFASQIYANEHVKVLVYGAGPKVAWRQRRWEPWMHAIFGGSHELPKTATNSKNAFAIETGGGGDYRWNPRLSFRLEGNYVRTTFFSRTQNNFEVMGGVVFHF
jgi:hypothetical protein